MDTTFDIAIVGGGAAGLASAIFAAEAAPGAQVVILDGAARLGAKILVAGGGRCNVTHQRVRPEDYNAPKAFVRSVLKAFDEQATVRWFESMGVTLKTEDTGKLFPTTDQARTVLEALLQRAWQAGSQIQTRARVAAIEPEADMFLIRAGGAGLRARRVILCAGGRSLPKSGSDGSGLALAAALGHTVTATRPALVPLVLRGDFFHAGLSGLSLQATLTTVVKGKRVDRRSGSLLWTHFGISGPLAMDASRHWVCAQEDGLNPELHLALIDEPFEAVDQWLQAETKRTIGARLAERLPRRLVEALTHHVGVDPAMALAHLPREARRTLTHALIALPLPVEGPRGWNYAEVTAGGVVLDEVDRATMASRRVPGLYLAGEVLDCDGRIGGFNFQWAWATGFLAGRAAATLS